MKRNVDLFLTFLASLLPLLSTTVRGENVSSSNLNSELVKAATSGDRQSVEDLLKAGADVEARDTSGRTPLYLASEQGKLDVVELLLARGADINAITGGTTPLHRACNLPSDEIAKLLIKRGAGVNVRNKGGLAPLDVAACFGRMDIAILLIDKGSELHTKDRFGRTPVFWAFNNAKVEMAEFLMSKGVKHDPPVRERKFEPRPLSVDDPRMRFIVHFKDVLILISNKDVDGVFSKIADGHGDSFRLLRGGKLQRKWLKDRDLEKLMKRNFLFSDTVLKNFEKASYAKLVVINENISVTGPDQNNKLAATLYVMPVSIPGVTDKRFDELRFVEVDETLYWVPFGW
jgi:ankyrin repeat protein